MVRSLKIFQFNGGGALRRLHSVLFFIGFRFHSSNNMANQWEVVGPGKPSRKAKATNNISNKQMKKSFTDNMPRIEANGKFKTGTQIRNLLTICSMLPVAFRLRQAGWILLIN